MAGSKGHKEGRKQREKERERDTYEQRKERINLKNESDGKGFLVVGLRLLFGGHVSKFPSFFFFIVSRR